MRTIGTCIAVLTATALVAAGCGDDDSSKSATESKPAATTATETATTATGTTPTTGDEPDVDHEFAIEVTGGAPTGGPEALKVAAGDSVQLTVTSDVADEVHVHGVDASVDVEPGTPAQVTFTPEDSGSFEIELENSGTLLAMLEVR